MGGFRAGLREIAWSDWLASVVVEKAGARLPIWILLKSDAL